LTDEDKKKAAETAESGAKRTRLSGHFELDFPKPEHHAAEASQKKNTFLARLGNDFQKPRFYLEIAALIGLFCYVHSASIQANANKKAADAAKQSADAAVAATRAWIVFKNFEKAISNGRIVIIQNYENGGKTPAINAFTGFQYKIAETYGYPPRFDKCEKLDLRQAGTSPPNIPYMAAGEPFSINEPLNDEETRLAQKGPGWFYIHECIRYHDVLSTTEHLMELCADLGSGALCGWNNQEQ
jgi:hypothetical protein